EATDTPKPEATNTPKPEATNTPKPEATNTPEPEATNTPEPEATNTPEPEATNTPEPTNTPKPEATNTPKPEATNTPEPEATNTPEPEATNTPEPVRTPEPEATNTPEPEATNTPKPEATNIPEPEVTNTPEPEATNTPEPEATNTPEPEATNTPEPGTTSEPIAPGTDTPAQESQKPFIKGDSGKEGWDVIRAEEEKAEAGSRINVDMNGTSVVPGDIFDTIRGRDVTVTFDMGGGICWSVDGKQILTHQAADIDFSVKPGTDTIPLEIVNRVSGERYSIQLSLAYNGEFGFTAVLSVNLGRENTGLTASLYYYNHNAGELAFVCKEKVDGDGMVSFPFTHASDYIIVIDEAGEEDSGGTVPGQPAVTAAPDVASGNAVPTKESPKTGEEEKKPACPTVAGILAGAGVAIIMAWRRKENRRK
ncbi:MAG TPA: hypothetical protein DCZ91_08720, partial [Lachnospiraceae bacterium]|nr:hypothetical protein [Lachnospiraceae bacterium]